jgi:hypothetical protein
MDTNRFTELASLLRTAPSRREVLRGFIAAGLGLSVLRRPEALDARKGKKRPKKQKNNAFGCLNVGQPCRGKDDKCCSGICQGRKPRKGKKDTSKCAAHGAGTCDQEALGICTGAVPALATCNNRSNCACFQTTGASRYCAELFGPGLSQCAACLRDADCVAMGLPSGSACAPVSQGFCAGTCPGGMACLVPCGTGPPPP